MGRKIHAGRSRNDQVAVAMRLFMRHHALNWLELLGEFAQATLQRADRDGNIAMPGYTHLQPAMPSSVGQWLHAAIEAALEQVRAVFDLVERLDACPLGTGAGYGVPLPLNRARVAEFRAVRRAEAEGRGGGEAVGRGGVHARSFNRFSATPPSSSTVRTTSTRSQIDS